MKYKMTVLLGCVFLCVSKMAAADLVSDGSIVFGGTYPSMDTIAAVSTDRGGSWQFLNDPFGQYDFMYTGQCNDTAKGSLCVMGGSAGIAMDMDIQNLSEPADLMMSIDGGSTWKQSPIKGLPPYNFISVNSLNCFSNAKSGVDAHCMLIGEYALPNTTTFQAFVAESNDNARNWHAKHIDGLPADTFQLSLLNSSCSSADDNDALCAAPAFFYMHNALVLGGVITSSDDGKTWKANLLDNITGSGNIYMSASTSCTGSGADSMCALVELDTGATTTNNNLIFVSKDRGNSWQSKSYMPLAPNENSSFGQVSCTGSGSRAICAAIGGYYNPSIKSESPLLVVSSDGGNNWVEKQTFGASSVSCAGRDNNTVCMVLGGTDTASSLAVSTDGNTWTQSTNLPTGVIYTQVSCQTSRTTGSAICLLKGSQLGADGNNYPVLSESFDNGKTWMSPIIQGLTPANSANMKWNA